MQRLALLHITSCQRAHEKQMSPHNLIFFQIASAITCNKKIHLEKVSVVIIKLTKSICYILSQTVDSVNTFAKSLYLKFVFTYL